jgi:hypothetical protein
MHSQVNALCSKTRWLGLSTACSTFRRVATIAPSPTTQPMPKAGHFSEARRAREERRETRRATRQARRAREHGPRPSIDIAITTASRTPVAVVEDPTTALVSYLSSLHIDQDNYVSHNFTQPIESSTYVTCAKGKTRFKYPRDSWNDSNLALAAIVCGLDFSMPTKFKSLPKYEKQRAIGELAKHFRHTDWNERVFERMLMRICKYNCKRLFRLHQDQSAVLEAFGSRVRLHDVEDARYTDTPPNAASRNNPPVPSVPNPTKPSTTPTISPHAKQEWTANTHRTSAPHINNHIWLPIRPAPSRSSS